jgi:hypothetical protein
VSEQREKTSARPVSMAKKPPAAGPVAPGGSTPLAELPRTVQLTLVAVVAEVVFTIAHALAARGFTSQLTQLMIDANKHAKKPVKNFDAVHALSQYRSGLLIQGLVVCAALLILGYSLRKPRAASGARWGLLIVLVLTVQSNGPFTIFPISNYPAPLQVLRTLIGVSSVVLIVGLLMPSSMRYFRACREATRPAGGAPRGLAGLFGARAAGGARPAPRAGAAGRPVRGGRPGAAPSAEPVGTNPARGKARAKVRADADAVAKGAELARNRAKASKSRRTAEPS